MYEAHFGFTEPPFSIAPNPRYLFMSEAHNEALAHLVYGLGGSGGGFVLLTGEIGTGKTTLCRKLLASLPDNVEAAVILNTRIDELELMQSICDEFGITTDGAPTVKRLLDALNRYLLDAHAAGRNPVLIIDEAQNLSRDVLEQVRLLTNLETTTQKLLQIILIGQPELGRHLADPSLRQLDQRITARYHLAPLARTQTRDYVRHRLRTSGCDRELFTRGALAAVHRVAGGVPRLINVICDRALMGAWAEGRARVTSATVAAAGREVAGAGARRWPRRVSVLVGVALLVSAPVVAYTLGWLPERIDREVRQLAPSWLPRFDGAARGPAIGGLGAWIARAEAADASPRLAPYLDPAPPARQQLAPRGPHPVALSTLPSIDTGGLDETLGRASAESLSRVAALRRLGDAWSVPDAAVFDCIGVAEFGLSCFQGADTLDELLVLDRPAVVELGETGGRFAALRHVIGDTLVIDIAGDLYGLSRETFEAAWKGGSVVFWRRPPLKAIPVDENSVVEDVLWLRRALNLEAVNHGGARLSRVEHGVFDAELRAALAAFQRRNSLVERERAGEVELIVLGNRLGYESRPVLSH